MKNRIIWGVTIVLLILLGGFFYYYRADQNNRRDVYYAEVANRTTALEKEKLDPISVFPSIRLFGTVGFICAMLLTDVLGFQASPNQIFFSAVLGLVAAGYACTLPACPVIERKEKKSLSEALGLNAFSLFKFHLLVLQF